MDQLASNVLTFAAVTDPHYGLTANLVFKNGHLLGQLKWEGFAPEYRGKLALGTTAFDGKFVFYANGPYGAVERASIEEIPEFILKAWSGGAK